MNRKSFLKWTGLSAIAAIVPVSLSASAKHSKGSLKIDDVFETRHEGNKNLLYLKDSVFRDEIVSRIKQAGIPVAGSMMSYAGGTNATLGIKDSYSETEIRFFLEVVLKECLSRKALVIHGNEDFVRFFKDERNGVIMSGVHHWQSYSRKNVHPDDLSKTFYTKEERQLMKSKLAQL